MDCAIFAVITQGPEALRLILAKPSDRLSWNEGHQRHQVGANGEAVNTTSERPGYRTAITARGVAAAIATFRATCTP